MKTKKHGLLHLLIAAAAVINLVFLFLFQYGLSNATPAVQAAQRASEERAAYDEASGFGSQSPESGAMIVTSGLSAEEENSGLPEEDQAAAAAEEADESAGENSEGSGSAAGNTDTASNTGSAAGTEGEGVTLSSSNTSSAEETAEPSITLSSDLPLVDLSELSTLAKVFTDLGALSADDGYGNDISDRITTTYEQNGTGSMEYNVVFSVMTSSGKTASEKCTITIDKASKPILELKSDNAKLSVNSEYHYLDYVKTAMDIDGSSLMDSIELDGYIALGYAGTYEMTYYVISAINGERVEKTLTMTIE